MLEPSIDHIIHNVRTGLDEAVRAYSWLGFSVTKRNRHPFGSSNHLIVLDESYVEILGFEPGTTQGEGALTSRRLGLMGLAFKPLMPVEELRLELLRNGAAVGNTFSFSRPAALEQGEAGVAAFDLLYLPDGTTDDGAVFFCEHRTPSLVWREAWQSHPNGACSIKELVISTLAPEATAEKYARVFRSATRRKISGGVLLGGKSSAILFLDPEKAYERLGSNPHDVLNYEDQMVGIVFGVRSIEQSKSFFATGAIAERSIAVGSRKVTVPSHLGGGVSMLFESAV